VVVPEALGQAEVDPSDAERVATLANLGARVEPLVQCLARFHEELQAQFSDLSKQAVPMETRNRWSAARQMLSWASSAAVDLRRELGWARRGFCALELRARLARAARAVGARRGIVVEVLDRGGLAVGWGQAVLAQRMLEASIEYAVERIDVESLGAASPASAAVVVELVAAPEALTLKVAGEGAVRASRDGDAASHLRDGLGALGWFLGRQVLGPREVRIEIGIPIRPRIT